MPSNNCSIMRTVMSEYEKQHYVSRFYLRYFAEAESRRQPDKSKWQIHVFDYETGQASLNFIPESAQAPWYFEDGSKDGELEHYFGRLETQAGEICKKLRETRTTSGLTNRNKKKLAEFLAAQHIRVPKHREFYYRKLIPRESFGVMPENLVHFVAIRKFIPFLKEYIRTMEKWELVENRTAIPLLISDSPLSLMPLSHPTSDSTPEFLTAYRHMKAGLVDFFNTPESTRIPFAINIPLGPDLMLVAGPDEDLFKLTEENVTLMNMNHVVQAHQYVYSATPDFKIAETAKPLREGLSDKLFMDSRVDMLRGAVEMMERASHPTAED